MVSGDPIVAHDDLELFLTGWYRAALAQRPEAVCRAAVLDKREPAPGDPFPDVLAVIRDDGGDETSIVTAGRSVGVSILCKRERDAVELARIMHALRSQIPSADPANPVARVSGSFGPYEVPDPQPRFRRYFTLSLVVVARSL